MEALEYQGTGASRLRWARACAAAALWSLPALVLPRTVPESAWKRDDPNAATLVEPEGLL